MPLMTAYGPDETDPGVLVKHSAFDDEEFIKLRSVLTDGVLEGAREAAAKKPKDGAAFQVALILASVLDWRIKDARKPGMPWIPLTDSGIRSISPQVRLWVQERINELDGSIAPTATTTVAGKELPFSGPVAPVATGHKSEVAAR